jgi:taurine dioxygenase
MRFRPLHSGFGAEVLECDLMTVAGSGDIEALQVAFGEYQLLLFRNRQRIPPERHVEIASWFGPAIDETSGQPWSTMDNENAAGSIRLPFHSDLTYTDTPIKVISLHAIELPPSGASTSYVSGVHAWATLPAERQELLSGLTLRHSYHSAISTDMPEFEADHPVRFLHPRTGQPVLFVTELHADRIYDLEQEDSDRILAELLAHLCAPEQLYIHRWQVDDFVIWDNLAVQHARTAEASIADGRRLLQRVALNEVTYDVLIERAWDRQRRRQLEGLTTRGSA